ncbi:MAG: hypothetical protein ACJAWV_004497 [Flammeovirgaceae bacterium]|jgi:hypothetical protein
MWIGKMILNEKWKLNKLSCCFRKSEDLLSVSFEKLTGTAMLGKLSFLRDDSESHGTKVKKAVLFLGIVLLLALSQFSASAQSTKSLKGLVVSEAGEVLFGNAILMSPTDSSVIDGTGFFDGKFTFSAIKSNKILLALSSLSFEDTVIAVSFNGNQTIDLGEIMVRESQQMLGELTIVSEGSLVSERADGSISVKVANTSLSTSTSVNEILSRSPSVVFDADGGIGIFGKGTVIIFLNGVKISADRLSAISPTAIESIEIISNPGPRYDAEGNAVINIIMKQNADEGAKGMIKNYLTHTDFAGLKNRTNLDYSYSKGKWAINSNYGLTVGKYRQILRTTRIRNIENEFFSSDLETDWQYDYDNFSNYNLGVQYNLTPKSQLSLQYTGAYEQLGGQQLSENTITDNEVGLYQSQIAVDELTKKNTFNLNYFVSSDSSDSELFVGAQYASYRESFDNGISESISIDGSENNSNLLNNGKNDMTIFSAQFDYTKLLKGNLSVEFGGKFGYVNVQANTAFFNLKKGESPTKIEELSNDFTYTETISASYLNFKGKINPKTNYSFGVRAELTDYELITSLGDDKPIEDNYLNIFPNASLNTKVSDETSLYFSYASRIRRVAYRYLNPFVLYQDAFTSIQGNSDIQSATFHSVEVGGNHKDWSLKMSYTYAIDPMYGGAFQAENNPKGYILQRYNMSAAHLYFASLSRNLNLKFWQSINTISVSRSSLVDNRNSFTIDKKRKPYFYFYSQNSFTLKGNLKLYLTALYRSEKEDGIYLRNDQSSVNLGLETKLMNKNITLNVDFNDIFYKVRAAGEYTLGETDIIFARQYNTNFVRFSVSYNFGKLKKSNFKNRDVGKEERNRA